MCNSCNDSNNNSFNFDDLVDGDEIGGAAHQDYLNEDGTAHTDLSYKAMQPRQHKEKCKECRNGTFYSWAGRPLGACRKCKGTGFRYFRQSLEQREKARIRREEKKAEQQREVAQQATSWKNEYEAEYNWLCGAANYSDFASSLLQAVNKYGQLTERQLAAVQKILRQNEEKKAAQAARQAAAPTINVGPIYDAFQTALDNGLKRPKMYLEAFKFSLAPASGKNAGCIYVIQVENDQYLGKITPEKRFLAVRSTSEEQEAAVIEVCANPLENAIAYGKRTGNCSCCARELTNQESIDRGIGPICAQKYGW